MKELIIQPDLTDRQKQAFSYLLDRESTEILFGGQAGGGKALSINNLVATPFGFRKMNDLQINDIISDPETGGMQKIIATYELGKKDIYEIEFVDGAKTKATLDHLWKFKIARRKWRKSDKTWKICTTEKLIYYLSNIKNNIQIPLTQPIKFTKSYKVNMRLIHPYILGVLIGDGNIVNAINFSSNENEIVDNISKYLKEGYSITNTKDKYRIIYYKVGINPMIDNLKKIGLLGKRAKNKFIPQYYKLSTIKDRELLMQGLIDTDGYVDSRGHLIYSTISKILADDVAWIARSLGNKATITKQKAGYKKNNKYKRCNDVYNIYIQGRNLKNLVRLKRKKERIKKYNAGKAEPFRTINSIKLLNKEKVKCIIVDSIHGLFLTDDFIVTHNSTLGCMWIITSALQYYNTQWLIGRSVLKNLKETTMRTFFDVCGWWKLKSGLHFDYNTKDNFIQFRKQFGGSLILMKDLFSYPSDPEYDSLGSLEITGAFIDEGSQVAEKAKNIVNSRIRYKLDKYNLIPKLLVGSNPAKNWLYSQFYRPDKDGTLPVYRKFVKASVYENPYISPFYIENLKKLDPISKSRLLEGNWEYELDEYVLIGYDEIANIFTNKEIPQSVDWYITCDYARFGKDKTVILVWNGWRVEDYKVMDKSSIPQAVEEIEKFMSKYAVTTNRVIVDEEGVGSGVVDVLRCQGFVNSATPIKVSGEKENYANLKAQCYFRFAEKINRGEVYFKTHDINLIGKVVEELEHLKRKDPDKDGKLAIMGKDKVKEEIGRSPDYSDAMMMRIYFDIKKHRRFLI